jgi:hypothetical protein
MYPLETLWDDGEFVLSRSVPDSVGKRMPKAYLQVAPASSRWCRPWRRAPPAATMRPNNQLPSGEHLTTAYDLRRPLSPLFTLR